MYAMYMNIHISLSIVVINSRDHVYIYDRICERDLIDISNFTNLMSHNFVCD